MMNFTPVKYGTDGAAFTAAFAHWWGAWSGQVASIASTLAVIWICIQMYFFVKDRWFK
jgi:hypothetical protein